jgi:hypothetical protein
MRVNFITPRVLMSVYSTWESVVIVQFILKCVNHILKCDHTKRPNLLVNVCTGKKELTQQKSMPASDWLNVKSVEVSCPIRALPVSSISSISCGMDEIQEIIPHCVK